MMCLSICALANCSDVVALTVQYRTSGANPSGSRPTLTVEVIVQSIANFEPGFGA